jgi:AcrR family transcriptional regulator
VAQLDFAEALTAVLRRADSARRGGRREGDAVVPLGPRAAKTRSALLAAGVDQFVRRGYIATSVEHVHEAAGVSLGTFYQYFRDKADLMTTLVGEAILDTAASMFRSIDLTEGPDAITRLLDRFVTGYASTAAFQRVWEEATHVDDDLAALRRDVSRLLERALSEAIVAAQASAAVDRSLDAVASSRALAAMVDRYCYLTYVVDADIRTPTEYTVETLVRLWTRALGVGETRGRRRLKAASAASDGHRST